MDSFNALIVPLAASVIGGVVGSWLQSRTATKRILFDQHQQTRQHAAVFNSSIQLYLTLIDDRIKIRREILAKKEQDSSESAPDLTARYRSTTEVSRRFQGVVASTHTLMMDIDPKVAEAATDFMNQFECFVREYKNSYGKKTGSPPSTVGIRESANCAKQIIDEAARPLVGRIRLVLDSFKVPSN